MSTRRSTMSRSSAVERRHPFSRSPYALPVLAAAFLALAAAECESLKATGPISDPDPNGDGDPAGYTEPAALVQAFAAAHEERDYAAYESLLHDAFEFRLRASDVDDFPWLSGDSWGRTQELQIAAHLFDPNYSGYEAPVTAISLTATILSQETNDDGSREVTAAVNGTILKSATDGWSFDTRLIFRLVPVGGFLKIREITEVELLRPTMYSSSSSFGSIKGLYK